MRYPVVLFDLFRTVALFDQSAPTGQVNEPHWRAAMGALSPLAAELLPDVPFDAFLDALTEASREVARRRPPEHREVPIAKRYGHALERLGQSGPGLDEVAARLAAAQLDAQLAGAHVPDSYRRLLAELSRTRRLGLVSNFDDGPAAHRLLEREGIASLFSVTVISIEVGRRKPHREIFAAALEGLGAHADEALFVGDSAGDDVAGARGAGMDAAWLNAAWKVFPDGLPKPTYVLARLTDLTAILADPGTSRETPTRPAEARRS